MSQTPTELLLLPKDMIAARAVMTALATPALQPQAQNLPAMSALLSSVKARRQADDSVLNQSLKEIQSFREELSPQRHRFLIQGLETLSRRFDGELRERDLVQTQKSQASKQYIAGYEIIRTLGQGAMGIVYLARSPQTGGQVALKVLLDGSDPSKVDALVMEAEAARRVDSPYCVKVLAVIKDNSTNSPALVMEYVEGLDAEEFFELEWVREIYEQDLLPISAKLLIMAQMMKAVTAAHDIGLVHQDIKPSNFLISQGILDDMQRQLAGSAVTAQALEQLLKSWVRRPWVKLTDWGLALVKEPDDLTQSLRKSLSVTSIDDNKKGGTLLYMPLEQIDGEGISRATDIYSLGLVFYQVLTGRPVEEARKHSEGIDDEALVTVQGFLIALSQTEFPSSISSADDPNLHSYKHLPLLLDLLETMTRRDKQQRVNFRQVAYVLENYSDFSLDADLADSAERLVDAAVLKPKKRSGLWVFGALAMVTVALIAYYASRWNSKAPAKQYAIKALCAFDPEAPGRVVTVRKLLTLRQLKPFLKDSTTQSLALPKLKTLSPELAKALSAFSGQSLAFNEVKELSDAALKALKDCPAKEIQLRGLKSIPEKQIELFKQMKTKRVVFGAPAIPSQLKDHLTQSENVSFSWDQSQ